LDVLDAILAGKELDHAWSNVSHRMADWEPRDRAFTRQLVMTTLRHYGAMRAQLASYLRKRPPEKAVRVILLGMAQLLWLDTPPHAAVDTSVTLAKKIGLLAFSGLVNAVLKRIASDVELLRASSDPKENLPEWLRTKLLTHYGNATLDTLARAHQIAPPLDITLRDDTPSESLINALEAVRLPTGSLRRALTADVATLPGYDAGLWWVQDAAATIPVRLFSDLKGRSSLDLCAAPGGKTLQMAASGAMVTAVDKSSVRLRRLHDNLRRTGLVAHVVEADAMDYTPESPPERILLDAPCTATGTLRRHPDVAWHRRPADVIELGALQHALLVRAFHLLAPGGELVYCVCSLLAEEGEQQAQRFLATHSEARVKPINAALLGIPPAWITTEGGLRTLPSDWPEKGGLDGFYAICISKPALL
jgi:16S rRNA (cytosine967-C5)-methyltransferase